MIQTLQLSTILQRFSVKADINQMVLMLSNVNVYFISDCREHHAIAHATITYDTNFTTVNNTAKVQCQSGYKPDGVHVIKCQENGTWSSSQSCTVKGQCNICYPSKILHFLRF